MDTPAPNRTHALNTVYLPQRHYFLLVDTLAEVQLRASSIRPSSARSEHYGRAFQGHLCKGLNTVVDERSQITHFMHYLMNNMRFLNDNRSVVSRRSLSMTRIETWEKIMVDTAANVVTLFAQAFAEIRDLRDTEHIELDDVVRARAPGKFVVLERGAVHYELVGPERGPTVLLLGGATIGMWFWDRTVTPLVDAGFRVLRFDFLGRGFSDRPHDPQTPRFFTDQIEQILSRLCLAQPFHLVGIAMSALSAIHYANLYPRSVASLSLLTPDGLGTARGPLTELMLVPGIGDYLFDLVGAQAITQRLSNYSSDEAITRELISRTQEELKIKGFKRSVLSGLRHMPINDDSATIVKVAAHNLPTLVVWGERDKATFGTGRANRMAELIPHAETHVLDTGHLPQYEAPELVNPILLDFLRKASAIAISG